MAFRRRWIGLLALLLALPAGLVSPPEAGAQEVQRYGDVPYLTGGVGEEEREAIETLAAREGMNLHVILTQRGGAFVSDVSVRVIDADGSVHLEATTEGPWLLARLPAGEYRVRAELRGGVQEGNVTVPERARGSLVLAFP